MKTKPNAKTSKPAKPARIRKRTPKNGSASRPYMLRVRMTREVSSAVASMQGLCWRFGKRETIADLFEKVCAPALRRFVDRYAKIAKASRAKAGKVAAR